MSEGGRELREQWISEAVALLRAGQGHMGVILFMRQQGLDPDRAKRMSFDVFDEAKRRLMRGQMGYRWGGRLLIFIGLMGPVVMFLVHSRVVIVSAAPLFGGLALLAKVVNPGRLPEGGGDGAVKGKLKR